MTLPNVNLEPLLKKAKKCEKKYDWLAAAEIYEEASRLVQEDSMKVTELRERIGYCFLRAAFQAETNEQFRSKLQQSAEAYEKVVDVHQETEVEDKEARINRAKAMVAYVNALYTKDTPKRRGLLDKWWKLENDALNYYEKVNDLLAIGRVCNDLVEKSVDRLVLESNWEGIRNRLLESIDYGEKAIIALSDAGDKYELACAYCSISRYYGLAMWFRALDIGKETHKKILKYRKMALELSEKTGDAYLIGWANLEAALYSGASGNLGPATKFWKNAVKYGAISKDNNLIGGGSGIISAHIYTRSIFEVDPDKQREECKTALKFAQDSIHYHSIIDDFSHRFSTYFSYVDIIKFLASIETNLQNKRHLLENAVKIGRENLENIEGETIMHGTILLHAFSNALYGLAEIETEVIEKQQLLEEALEYREKQLKAMQQISPFDYNIYSLSHKFHALIFVELSKMGTRQEKIELLEKAISAMEKCVELIQKDMKDSPLDFTKGRYGLDYYLFGGILEQLYTLTKDKKLIERAIENFKNTIVIFSKLNLKSRVAESYWQIARLKNHLGKNLESAHNYQLASENYKLAAEKMPQLKEFYDNYSLYMQAWSEIEQARYSHTIEDYEEAKQHYEKAANFHESSSSWNYLTSNYFAWAKMEEAEGYSRKENTPQAKQRFQKAFEQFCNAQESFKQKLEEITTSEEKEMTKKLFEATELRRKYCRARILMEEAKLLDREGKYLQSSRSYGRAAQEIGSIVDKMDVEAERKELEYIAILCRAWEKMANAEETTSSESYLKAAVLFEQAKNHCYTKKASLWALGNSNFCRGLAAGLQYKTSLDLADHAKAKGYIKTASNDYLQAGFKNASEYAKATQRLFDAYVIMNQAEGEINQEKRAKQYQMAENLLQIAAGSFMKAKQPEKTAQVQEILANVREEKALAISLSQVMQAPSIASTTQSFTAPTPTSETSIGLESFEHANVQANLVTHVKEVKVGESFCLSIEFVNAGREPALLMRVDDFVPSNFVVVKKPEIYRIEESCLNMKGKQLAPLKLVEVKLTLQPSKKGQYQLNPKVHYLDELGKNKSLQLKALDINVEEVLLEHRVSTGTQELDSLLLGGIPQEYSVVLTGSASDEREYLIKNFLNAGIKEDEVVFYVSIEAEGLETLLEKSNFYLFLCNPKPKTQVPDLPNAFKLRSKTDLTNLSISLAKAYRNIEPSRKKRICIEIVSDVLLDYGSRETRKWISELKTDFGSKGFTMLAVINPLMHASEELHSVLDLFDGEIELIETEDSLECKKSIRVKKLRNQDYIKNPMCLTNHT
jgi:KaiC/GvpD/RAD55 family RecA-like ATPase